MAQCSVQELLSIAACWDCNLTGGNFQLQRLQTVLLCQILQELNPLASCAVPELIGAANANGFSKVTPYELQLLQTQLLCEILHAGGGAGQSCLLCGTGAPTEDPGCDCAIYYDKGTQEFWDWNGASWDKFIG